MDIFILKNTFIYVEIISLTSLMFVNGGRNILRATVDKTYSIMRASCNFSILVVLLFSFENAPNRKRARNWKHKQ